MPQVFLKLYRPTQLDTGRRLERYVDLDRRAARRANKRTVASLAVITHRLLAHFGKVGA